MVHWPGYPTSKNLRVSLHVSYSACKSSALPFPTTLDASTRILTVMPTLHTVQESEPQHGLSGGVSCRTASASSSVNKYIGAAVWHQLWQKTEELNNGFIGNPLLAVERAERVSVDEVSGEGAEAKHHVQLWVEQCLEREFWTDGVYEDIQGHSTKLQLAVSWGCMLHLGEKKHFSTVLLAREGCKGLLARLVPFVLPGRQRNESSTDHQDQTPLLGSHYKFSWTRTQEWRGRWSLHNVDGSLCHTQTRGYHSCTETNRWDILQAFTTRRTSLRPREAVRIRTYQGDLQPLHMTQSAMARWKDLIKHSWACWLWPPEDDQLNEELH